MTKKVPGQAFRRAFRCAFMPRERGECGCRACKGLRDAETRTVAGRDLVFSAPLGHQLRIRPAAARPCIRDTAQQFDYGGAQQREGHGDHELGVHAEWRDAVNTEDLEDVEQEDLHCSKDGGERGGKGQCQRTRKLARDLQQADENLAKYLSHTPQQVSSIQ